MKMNCRRIISEILYSTIFIEKYFFSINPKSPHLKKYYNVNYNHMPPYHFPSAPF